MGAGLEQLRRRLSGLFGGPGGGVRPGAIAAIAGLAFVLWTLTGVYVVQPNEEAVVTTFGAYSRSEAPGLRYHLPAPIERAEKVPVTTLNRIAIGGTGGPDGDVPQESLMLTSDENIIDLKFSVTWRVQDAARYLFATRNPEEAVKAVAESAMREVVGKTPLDPIFTTGRGKVQLQTAELMQRTLDRWGAGVSIVEVQISSVNPPQQALAAFRDVQSAEQDRDLRGQRGQHLPQPGRQRSQGDAAKITQSAQGYREQAVREATGDASRFNSIYNEYRRSPAATKDRLYIETMQKVLARSNKVIVDAKGASAPIILPPDVFKPRAPDRAGADRAAARRGLRQRSEAAPMTSRRFTIYIVVLIGLLIVLGNTLFVVDQRDEAIVVRLASRSG